MTERVAGVGSVGLLLGMLQLLRLVLPAALLGGLACGGDDATGRHKGIAALDPVTTDSAGVTLQVHAAETLERAPAITIDPTAIAVIRGSADDPDKDISTITPERFLPDGRLVGIDQQRGVITVFGADGSTRASFGRRGGGPGEFTIITKLLPTAGDSLIVVDPANSRITFFNADRGLGGEHSLSETVGVATSPLAMVGGLLLLWNPNFSDTPGVLPGAKGAVLDLASNTARRVFITGPQGSEENQPRVINTGKGQVMAVRAIRTLPLQRFPDAFGWQDEFVLTDGNTYRFEFRDTTGVVTRVLRIDRPRTAVTPAIWEAYVDDQVTAIGRMSGGGMTVVVGGGGGVANDTARMRADMLVEEHADSLPAFDEVFVTNHGTLWVVDYRVPGSEGWSATAYDTHGKVMGRLTQASGEPPVAFGDDRVVFRTEDDLGIATFTIERLRFPF